MPYISYMMDRANILLNFPHVSQNQHLGRNIFISITSLQYTPLKFQGQVTAPKNISHELHLSVFSSSVSSFQSSHSNTCYTPSRTTSRLDSRLHAANQRNVNHHQKVISSLRSLPRLHKTRLVHVCIRYFCCFKQTKNCEFP